MRTLCLTLATALFFAPLMLPAGETDYSAALAQRFELLIQTLDSASPLMRADAASELSKLAANPQSASQLATLLREALVRQQTSLEVRTHLLRLLNTLPEGVAPNLQAAPGEFEQLYDQLSSDDFSTRQAALIRLEWLLSLPAYGGGQLPHLKTVLANPELPADGRVLFTRLYQRARRTWLLENPRNWKLPAISEPQLDRWLDALTEPQADRPREQTRVARDAAERELNDALARDAYVRVLIEKLKLRVEKKGVDSDAAARLGKLYDVARPGLIAEGWGLVSDDEGEMYRQQMIVQHLITGVPQRPPMATKPTYFDEVTAERALCVSGNTLSDGEYYPVGRAIPHPVRSDYFFHLIYCPLPRIRMVYNLRINESDARLAELSRATCRYYLNAKQPIPRNEVPMLVALDPDVVSDFAGRFFLAVDDGPLDPFAQYSSRHTELCRVLAEYATRQIAPTYLEALAKNRILPPEKTNTPLDYRWLVPLLVAHRDPWPDVDRWLGDQAARTELLVPENKEGAEVGGTAAALLLERRGLSPRPYDLDLVEPALDNDTFYGYRFATPEGRQRFIEWWKEQQAEKKKDPA